MAIPLWRRPIDAFASSRPGSALLRWLGRRLDVPLLRATRGRFGLTFGLPVLLLTTTGRRSGEPRHAPVLYQRHGDALAVIGSHYGHPRHPAWVHNLRAKPEATVLLGGEEFAVSVREATGEERDELWASAVAMYGGYAKYAERVGDRVIPIYLLERATGA